MLIREYEIYFNQISPSIDLSSIFLTIRIILNIVRSKYHGAKICISQLYESIDIYMNCNLPPTIV